MINNNIKEITMWNVGFWKILSLSVFFIFISFKAYTQQKNAVKLPSDTDNVRKAQLGDPDAQAFIGKHYYFGEYGVKENNVEAYRWFQKSAAKGSPYGYYYLGMCYSNGFGVSQNYNRGESYFAKAFKLFKEKAESGNSEAQYYLGLCYQDGIGVEENSVIAETWFIKASEQGHPYAQYEVALKEKDNVKAFTLMQKAADHGIREAIFRLGMYYRSGYGCNKSLEKGTQLVLKAANMGDGDAQVRIAYCYEDGDGVLKDMTEAFKWFKKAADDNGMYEGYLEMGCKYRDGHLVDHNYDFAVKYLKKASDLETSQDMEASQALKIIRRLGRNAFLKQPKRCSDTIYELNENDPFLLYPIRGMENAPYEEKLNAAKRWKRDKIHAWGPEVAMKAAMGTYDIGFTMEQIAFALRDNYIKKYFDTPKGTIYLFLTSDRNFYFNKDGVLYGIVYENGVTVGHLTLIRSHDGNVKFIRDL